MAIISWKTRYNLTFLDPSQITNSINYTDFTDPNNSPLVNQLDNLNLPIMAIRLYLYCTGGLGPCDLRPGELQRIINQMVQAQADLEHSHLRLGRSAKLP